MSSSRSVSGATSTKTLPGESLSLSSLVSFLCSYLLALSCFFLFLPLIFLLSPSWYEYTYPEQLDDFAVILANHWERAGVEEKAMGASFKAALSFFRVGNMSSAEDFAIKARDLLISQSDGEDMSEELKVLLSRIDILLWRTHHELVGALVDSQRDLTSKRCKELSSAIAHLCNGFKLTGGLCEQLFGLTKLYFSYQVALSKAFSNEERQINREQLLSNSVDKQSDLGRALSECYHSLEVGKYCSSSFFLFFRFLSLSLSLSLSLCPFYSLTRCSTQPSTTVSEAVNIGV